MYSIYILSGFLLVCFFGHILHVGYVFNFWKCPETYLRHLKTVNIYFGDVEQFAASHFILFIPCHENLEFLFMAELLSDVGWPDTPSPRPGLPNFKTTAEEMFFFSPTYYKRPPPAVEMNKERQTWSHLRLQLEPKIVPSRQKI